MKCNHKWRQTITVLFSAPLLLVEKCIKCGKIRTIFDKIKKKYGAKMRGDKQKHDSGKPMWDLLPLNEVGEIVDVLTFGAKKYGPNNWKTLKDGKNRYFAALMRHLVAWKNGNKKDKESGIKHLAHAGCCLLFLMWLDK